MSKASGNVLLTPTPGATPPDSFGTLGDFCFDSSTSTMYGPKTSATPAWVAIVFGGGGGLNYVDLSTANISINHAHGAAVQYDFSGSRAQFAHQPKALNIAFDLVINPPAAANGNLLVVSDSEGPPFNSHQSTIFWDRYTFTAAPGLIDIEHTMVFNPFDFVVAGGGNMNIWLSSNLTDAALGLGNITLHILGYWY